MPDEASDEMVAFRLAPRDRAAIQRLIQAGEFRNRSDFLRYAVKATLAQHLADAPPARAPLDLDLPGVDLPPQATRAQARRRGMSHQEVNL